jgi:tRNA-Thr(GGU) m(6)t(6)A37 methyltransferase TsaA
MSSFAINAIGKVSSSLKTLDAAPRQADEGAAVEGLRSIRPGDELVLITWLDRARRDVLSVHPRGDVSRTAEGVFSTRSPHRPNPLGLHEVTVTAIEGARVRVRSLEAIDGTPIVDVKPVLSPDIARR